MSTEYRTHIKILGVPIALAELPYLTWQTQRPLEYYADYVNFSQLILDSPALDAVFSKDPPFSVPRRLPKTTGKNLQFFQYQTLPEKVTTVPATVGFEATDAEMPKGPNDPGWVKYKYKFKVTVPPGTRLRKVSV